MFLQLNHKNLAVYNNARDLVKEVYRLSNQMPDMEKFNMVQQVRRAALSVKLNLAEGSSRKSELERKRYFEIARGSVVELDAAFETAVDLNYYNMEQLESFNKILNSCFAMISNLIH